MTTEALLEVPRDRPQVLLGRPEHGEAIAIRTGRFGLPRGRTLTAECGMTTRLRIEAQQGPVEVRELEGAKSQPRTVATHVVGEGDSSEVHVWQGHWLEIREAAP